MSIHQQLGLREPLATYGTKDCREVWSREQAMKALRELVGEQGLVPGAYALHCGRIGGAPRLVSSGFTGVGHPTTRGMKE